MNFSRVATYIKIRSYFHIWQSNVTSAGFDCWISAQRNPKNAEKNLYFQNRMLLRCHKVNLIITYCLYCWYWLNVSDWWLTLCLSVVYLFLCLIDSYSPVSYAALQYLSAAEFAIPSASMAGFEKQIRSGATLIFRNTVLLNFEVEGSHVL